MIIFQILSLLVQFTIVPISVGSCLTYKASAEVNKNKAVVYLVGFFGSLGVFYILNTLVSIVQDFARFRDPIKGSFIALCIMYTIACLIFFFCWINRTVFGAAPEVDEEDEDISEDDDIEDEPDLLERLVDYKNQLIAPLKEKGNYTIVYALVFVAALCVQIYFAHGYQVNQWSWDDYDYVVLSSDNIANDVISVTHVETGAVPSTSAQRMAVSWTTYVSYLSFVTRFDVATMCHTCLNMLLILVAYLAYYFVATCLFKDVENQMMFMTILSALFIFGYHSHYSITFRMLCTIWQGKAVLYVIAVPFLMFYLAQLYELGRRITFKKEKRECILGIGDVLPLSLVSVGICGLTVMSILLVSAVTVFMWIAVCIKRKGLYGFWIGLSTMIGPAFGAASVMIFKIVEKTGRGL